MTLFGIWAEIVHFLEGNKLNMEGVDIFKIENGKIQEVWTFAKNQESEDEYWR